MTRKTDYNDHLKKVSEMFKIHISEMEITEIEYIMGLHKTLYAFLAVTKRDDFFDKLVKKSSKELKGEKLEDYIAFIDLNIQDIINFEEKLKEIK